MENKEKYYLVFAENNGQLNEIDLGESLGLTEDETREIIAQLLSEHRLQHRRNKASNYSLMTRRNKKVQFQNSLSEKSTRFWFN